MSGKKKWQKLLRLAGTLPVLVVGTAFAANSVERPRPENYANYSQYIQALVDYQRNQEKRPESGPELLSPAELAKLCREDAGQSLSQKSKDPEEERKRNACRENLLLGENLIPDEGKLKEEEAKKSAAPAYEDLEEAIARAQASQQPDHAGRGTLPRSTYDSFPLAEISPQDLSRADVPNLLGKILSMARLPPGATSRSRADSPANLNPDGSLRTSIDNYTLRLEQVSLTQLAQLGGIIGFGAGYTIFSSTASFSGSGLQIDLSSETHTKLYIVDRDGLPGSGFEGAGAVVIDDLDITIPMLEVNIQGVRGTSNTGFLTAQINSPQAITVDLSSTRIGVADAVRDGSRIGNPDDFLVFGPQSVLTIAPGTSVTTVLSNPDSTRTPFVTFNGHIGDISLADIRLLDNNSGGGLTIGNLALRNIDLVNAKFFINDQNVIVDLGTGMTNLEADFERVYLGTQPDGAYIGDFYARNGNLTNLRFIVGPH